MIRFLRFSALNLTLGYIVLGIAVLVLFATPLLFAWRQNIDTARIASLQEDSQRMADVFEKEGADALANSIEEQVGRRVASNRLVLFADAAFSPIAGNLAVWPPEITQSSGMSTLEIELGDSTVQTVFMAKTLPGGYNLLVGRDITRFKTLESLFWYGLAGAAGIIVLLGIFGGWQIRRVLLSEVQGIGQTASAIVAGDLSRRLPTNGGRDELDILAQTINRMLEQIEHLVHGVRNVSNAIAHDLRTPLAELRARLEELSVTRPPPDETFAEIEGAVADVDRVMDIFNALLRLAEIDSGARRSGFVQVDLTQVASEAVEFYQPVAELKGVKLRFEPSGALHIVGDPLLIAQAIGNLVDNAVKYARDRGTIVVQTLQRADDRIEISVSDDGPGILDNEKAKVTERFYRGDASRVRAGTGLGLSLVAAVAKLHGGALTLTDNHPGLRASVIFPAEFPQRISAEKLS
jgi:signal transduction histidine kinase